MRDGLGAMQRIMLLGGTSEIGLAIVRELAKDGRLTDVFLAVRSVDSAAEAIAALSHEHPGLNVVAVQFDAAKQETYEPAFDTAFSGGSVDCVISSFGLLGTGVDCEQDLDGVRQLLDVNYTGAILTGTIAVQRFRTQGYGSLVVLSSVAAERSRLDNYVYASTKAGVDAWASGMADSLVGSGIQVLVVRPGFVHTKMTEGLPVAPLATTPEVVAEQTVKALRKGSSLVWAPAGVRPLMSTLRHLPRPVFRVVTKRASGS